MLVLVVGLGLVFGFAQLLGVVTDPGTDQARTVVEIPGASGTSSQPPSSTDPPLGAHQDRDTRNDKAKKKKDREPEPLAEPSGPCERSDLVLEPELVGPAYAGAVVRFRINVTTLESPACTWTASSSSLVVKLTSGTDRIWSSQECTEAIPALQIVPRKKVPATLDVRWHGRRSDETCSGLGEWALPGTYHIEAAAYGAEPSDSTFDLVLRERATVTSSPKPEKDRSPGAGSAD